MSTSPQDAHYLETTRKCALLMTMYNDQYSKLQGMREQALREVEESAIFRRQSDVLSAHAEEYVKVSGALWKAQRDHAKNRFQQGLPWAVDVTSQDNSKELKVECEDGGMATVCWTSTTGAAPESLRLGPDEWELLSEAAMMVLAFQPKP